MAHNQKTKALFIGLIATAIFLIAVALGSVPLSLGEIWGIFKHKLLGLPLEAGIDSTAVSILWEIRLPRVCLAFLVGGSLAVSGAVMQSLLQNPLASSYTLGVSSGASLGAMFVIVSGATIPFFGAFTLPFMGFGAGFATVLLVLLFVRKMDVGMGNQTIILVGMVFSLFVNAILTLLSVAFRQNMQQLLLWQMGSFASSSFAEGGILLAVLLLAGGCIFLHHREMDLMTFGEETALAAGVQLKRVKMILLLATSLLTGAAVAFTGIIGFIDLVAPHVVRKIFGESHRWAIPMAAVLGGTFAMAADLLARTVLSPIELPVGAITALIGAPFFAYLYFRKGKQHA